MSKNDCLAESFLDALDATVMPKVNSNRQIVREFLEKLNENLDYLKWLAGISLIDTMHVGSAYEGLAVEEETDFDITLVLDKPYVSENFSVGRDPSGFFTLQWKSHIANKTFCNGKGYLDAANLRRCIFDGLKECVRKIRIPNAKLTCEDGLSAVAVSIEYDTGLEISIDLVPQIAFRSWGQCPHLKPLGQMPASLRKYIDNLNKNTSPVMFFSLGVPGADKLKGGHFLFNISFSLLEKQFICSDTNIRDMVRLVKVMADRFDWKKFKSYYAKRVAIKYYDELSWRGVWGGCKALLMFLRKDIGTGKIDGYFVSNQVTKRFTSEEVDKFREDIDKAMKMKAKSL